MKTTTTAAIAIFLNTWGNYNEYADINELNDLAAELESMDEYDREKLAAYIETQGGTIREAIDHLDRCEYYSGATLDDLAADFADEMLSGCPDFVSRYFDYDAFARDLELDGYTETENGVIYVY